MAITEDGLFGHGAVMLCPPWPGCWTVRIHPKYKDDIGIKVHEVDGHVADYLESPWTYGIRIKLSRKYRWECETKYYAMQYLCYPESEERLQDFVTFLVERYKLKITREQAESALRGKIHDLSKRSSQ